MGALKPIHKILLIFAFLGISVSYQNCSAPLFSSSVKNLKSKGGDTFDGIKTAERILHHYEDGFTCEGRSQPESILVRKNASDWYTIQNSKEKCAYVDLAPVSGVVYDDAIKQAIYLKKLYIAPKPLTVEASEPPNLPDIKLLDGVCEDQNFKCSLQASLDQAGINALTAEVQIEVPSATYLLTSSLLFIGQRVSNEVSLRGMGQTPAILDGQNAVSILMLNANPSTYLNFFMTNMTLQRGIEGILPSGVFLGTINLNQCTLQNNLNAIGGPIWSRGYNLIATETKIINNLGHGIKTYWGGNFVLDKVLISNNQSYGLDLDDSHLEIRNSTISNNSNGIFVSGCLNCLIENSTIYGQLGDGLNIYNTYYSAFTIRGSTIYKNAQTSGSNFKLFLSGIENRLVLINSIVAMNDGAKTNCSWAAGSLFNVEATNSLIDDSSCQQTGVGNISGDPLLGPLSNNGGFTPTLMPLASSPVIDAGDNATCLPTDQRGVPRNNICDIGSVEAQ